MMARRVSLGLGGFPPIASTGRESLRAETGIHEMVTLATFFRNCPSCGRRFEIRLVGREVLDASAAVSEVKKDEDHPRMYGVGGRFGVRMSLTASSPNPIAAEVDEVVRYDFRCDHCGHAWTEDKTKRLEGKIAGQNYHGD